MLKNLTLTLFPEIASDDKKIEEIVKQQLRFQKDDKYQISKFKRSIDARGKSPVVVLELEVYINEIPLSKPSLKDKYIPVTDGKKVIIIGAGPAGYFAALELIENGIKPVIFDRGKDVRSRRLDLRAIQQDSIVNPDSNYCFGEGGAGTYSDGKLYTRSHKRGDIEKALRILIEHGASHEILIDTHPHIGSNKLPILVQNLRKTILHYGGEINFDSRLTGFVIEEEFLKGIIINDKEEHLADKFILATGHSARDIFYLLKNNSIAIESKPFAIGVRIEHPQELIDEIQYKQNPRSKFLPASSYKLTSQVNGRGVFSFCMCPGGLIVPSATSPGEIVVNGMSLSRRDSKFANSGVVVAIDNEDLSEYKSFGEFDGLEFQKAVEKKFFDQGDGSQKAPAQRMTDFINKKLSSSVCNSSYIPGIYSSMINELLPETISEGLRLALIEFGKKMKGYLTEEALLIGVESRTSSPVRIPRNKETYEHMGIKNLYPSGEGAGYAGGIISAALDGQNSAKAIAAKIKN